MRSMAESSSQTCEDGCWGGLLCPPCQDRGGVGWALIAVRCAGEEEEAGQGREAR